MADHKDEQRTKEEITKEASNYLRGTIKEELAKTTNYFEEKNTKLLKFHGIYQQDNRDKRQERISKGIEKEYIFMIRTKLPGGQLTPKQYLGLDLVSEKYSNKTLRITTRQTIQFHGVIKGSLHETLNEINKNLIITYGACGDVVRNIMCCPVCDIDPDYSVNFNELVKEISNHLLPKSRAYYEIWVNDEKVNNNEEEPLYGKVYLPRKFKIGLCFPHDNCIDVFTQDIGVIAVLDKNPKIIGFNILVGGGLGHTHNKPETYPRLASELCFVKKENLIEVLEKIVAVQRDYGSRSDRKHARMKYLIDDRGLDWFKGELESRLSIKLDPIKLPISNFQSPVPDHLGWHKQVNDSWYLGLFIENGRICDQGRKKIKSGLREIVEIFNPSIRLTPQQNIILCNIKEENKQKIDDIVTKSGIYTNENVSPLRRNSMACPALPTCGLALAEAERTLPSIIDGLEQLGFKEEILSLRMSGCPNSCSRPPVAELGIIGMSANKYNIYLGGNFEGTRLNKLYKENVFGENLTLEIASLFGTYKTHKQEKEAFGDFCKRVGVGELKLLIDN